MSDLISRQDAIEAVMAEGRKVYTSECANAERIIYEADAVEALSMLPSADAVSREDYEKIKNMVSTQFQTVLEDYLELEKRYVALLGKQSQKPSAEAVSFEDARQIRNAILVKEYLRGRRDAEAVQGDGIPIELKKRYPHSRDEDITDAFMRGYQAHGEAVQGWIPCSERLPKKGEVVLITNGKGNVRCGQYRSEYDVRGETHYWWWKGKTVESVLAWMPLPKPYKGGEDE